MLQNLATNTFLLDRVFSGWCLFIITGLQHRQLARGKVVIENLRYPCPQSMVIFLGPLLLNPDSQFRSAEMISPAFSNFIVLLPLYIFYISLQSNTLSNWEPTTCMPPWHETGKVMAPGPTLSPRQIYPQKSLGILYCLRSTA